MRASRNQVAAVSLYEMYNCYIGCSCVYVICIFHFKRSRLYEIFYVYTSFQFGTCNSLKTFCQLHIYYIPNNGHLSESSDLSITIRVNEIYSVKLKSTIRYRCTRLYLFNIILPIRKGYHWRAASNLKVLVAVTFEIGS